MRKIKSLSLLFALFTAFAFVSCDTEPVDPVLSGNEGNPENPENPGTGPENPGTSSGDYWPMAVNNQWIFKEDGELLEPMKITGTATVAGNSYYKFDQFFTDAGDNGFDGQATILARKNGAGYSVRISVEIPAQEGGISITVSPFEYTVLKDDLAAGQSWNETVTQTTTTTVPGMAPIEVVMTNKYTGKILEKDVTVTLNGETYENVIKVELKQVSELGAGVPPTSIVTQFWWAKGVGPIKSQTLGVSNQELDSYIIN